MLLIYPARRYAVAHGGILYDSQKNDYLEAITAYHPDNPSLRSTIQPYEAWPQQGLAYNTLDGDGFQHMVGNSTNIGDIQRRIKEGVDRLHWSMTRLDKPYPMKVSLTPDLYDLRQSMINQRVLREDKLS